MVQGPAGASLEHATFAELTDTWPSLPPSLAIAAGEVHVVFASVPAAAASAQASALPADERARAARFRRAAPRAHYVAGRVVLREALGRCAGGGAAEAPLSSAPEGKPYLPESGAPCFSISHAGDVVLVALGVAEVGVDVEAARPRLDPVALARSVLGAGVASRLAELDPDAQLSAFLALWTRHEAALKCRGVGLAGDAAEAAGVSVRSLPLPPGYAAAVATSAPCTLVRWAWQP
jgi:4'-phosphopantetheinyl transferase